MSAPTSASAKTERLLNLVIALLSTRRPLTKSQIRSAVPQYRQTASVESFDRMFERDKDELRDLGIPLQTQVVDAVFEDETGYRIDRREYALPEISLEPDEFAALSLAARAWQRASLAGPAAEALRKLRSSGVELDDTSLVGIEPVVRTTEEAFEPLRRAVVARRAVTFGYRKPGGESTRRHLQPWGLAQWHGRWYVTGFDLDRDDARVFRLGRIDSPVVAEGRPGAYDVPAGHDPSSMVATSQVEPPPTTSATVRVRSGAGHTLRRRASASEELDGDAAGWSLLTVPAGDLDRLADEVAGFGPDALALDPPELREHVVRRLTGARARHTVAGSAS
ncbi:helix-turn-helix transcriptional regulator [Lapillicoccus jejuensis]|uniref:Transcriptional regulator n=1 Tax=Lapillicoccus jejuensis TaxID=402171 RepID=A0A542E4P9_9MICO|nr:WYL domain-containing protein [Lapillicoccus jejuensis]TQJ10320.1 transcriptional regulator [Lapillicoccus jejuensis]